MASKLRFTDGTTTVTFDGTTDGKVVRYDILTPELNTLTVSKVSRDGEDMIAQAYKDVVEEVELYVSGTWAQVSAKIRLLNRLWERVRRYQDVGVESPVYIQVMPDGDSEYWQSTLKSVRTDLEPSALDLFLGQGKVIFTVVITREYYWEATADVELQLYNPAQSKGTGGKSISNAKDTNGSGADRYNYLDIDNTDLVGDLPARVRLKMTNTDASATRWTRIFVGLARSTDIANFNHVIEGETCTQGSQLPATPDYTEFSEGYYRYFTWTGTTEQLLGRWDLSQTLLNATKSNYFMLYVKIWTAQADIYLRPKITAVSGLTTLWSGPQVLVSSGKECAILGPVQIPPVRQIGGTPFPENLEITAQRLVADGTMSIDYILLSPMEKWRQYIYNGYGCATDVWLMDDGIKERLYTDGWTPAGHLYNFVGYGPWLEVTPVPETSGKHRLIFLMEGGSYMPPTRTMTVQAWYRPRRKQI